MILDYYELQNKILNILSNNSFWNDENIKKMIYYIQLINGHKDCKSNVININELYLDLREIHNYNICNDYFTNRTSIKNDVEFIISHENYYKFIDSLLIILNY